MSERCRFVGGLDNYTNCATHGWTGYREEVKAIRVCPEWAGRAVQDDGLDVERLRKCPTLMVLLNRYGTFNDAWWDRLAGEYAGAAPPLHDPQRCDRIVNNGMGEPTECGRSLPCALHDPQEPERG